MEVKQMITKLKILIYVLLINTLMAPAYPVSAYPPDNAALLYYQAFMLYETPDYIGPMLWDYWKGNVESNEEIEEYLTNNRRVIDIVLDATKIDNCNWGLDYSQGVGVLLPPHQKAREIFALLAVEARMQADKGDYRKALDHSISIYKMANHLNERPLTCYIIGIAINAAANNCITQFLSEIPTDKEILTWLQNELVELDKKPYSIKHVLEWKKEAGIISMSPDKINSIIQEGLDDDESKEKALERIRKADETFYVGNINYWKNYIDQVQAAFEMPYTQAYEQLEQLDKKPAKDFQNNSDATLTSCLAPDFLQIYSLSIRLSSESNAIRAAIKVYLNRIATGRLPDELPEGLPKDTFSGKDFEYEKTDDGFILKCQGKDLSRDETYQYEFKVK